MPGGNLAEATTQRNDATQRNATTTIGKKTTKRTTRVAWLGGVARYAFGFFCRIPFKRCRLGYTFDDDKRTNRVLGQITTTTTENRRC
jgi:hypothetical protein